jgi:hypothetical protein
MLKYVIGRGMVEYETETYAQACRRHARMVAHNKKVERELERLGNPPTCARCGYPSGWHTPACRLSDPPTPLR